MRVVIKVGSSTITDNGVLSKERMKKLAKLIATLHQENDVLFVTSGAVAAGSSIVPVLSNKNTPQRQALAAVGQALLMSEYAKLFEPFGIFVAQILITKDDFRNFSRSENAKTAVNTLLSHKILPIINENDTVVIDELLRGDNDQLSAKVAHYFDADLLVILSDIDGYYDKNPKTNSDAKLLKLVDWELSEAQLNEEVSPNSEFATGGIVTKLKAADFMMKSGKKMFLASGLDLTDAQNFLFGKEYQKGSLFQPKN